MKVAERERDRDRQTDSQADRQKQREQWKKFNKVCCNEDSGIDKLNIDLYKQSFIQSSSWRGWRWFVADQVVIVWTSTGVPWPLTTEEDRLQA